MIRNVLLLAVFCTACAPARDGAEFAQDIDVSNRSPESIRLALRAANELSFEVLDDDASLDRRAAESIISNRPFADIESLDMAPWIGQRALDKLADFAEIYYATELPWEEDSVEALAILKVANNADGFLLTAGGLDDLVVEHVVEGRPFNSLAGLLDACSIEVDDLQLLLDLSEGVNCVEGTVLSTTGLTYDSLDEAIDDTPSNGLLTLCAGEYSLNRTGFRGINMVGAGTGRTRVHPEADEIYHFWMLSPTGITFVGGLLSVENLVDVELVNVHLQASVPSNWERVKVVDSVVSVRSLIAHDLEVVGSVVTVDGNGEMGAARLM